MVGSCVLGDFLMNEKMTQNTSNKSENEKEFRYMYAYVDGILEYVEPDVLIVDVNGLGINVHVYSSDILALPPVGERIRIYTYTSVAEDKFMLYGFLSKLAFFLYPTKD